MKLHFKSKLFLFILIAIITLSPICMATSAISANTNNEVDNSNIEASYEFVASDIYKFEQNVSINSTVDGNVFAFGENINITGEIGGDLFAFGNNVTISEKAYVHGNIFSFSNNLDMKGICYDIYSGGTNINISDSAIIARDMHIFAEKITINGQIKRDAYISTNNLILSDSSSNIIAGNLNYSSDQELNIDKNLVGGEIKFTQNKQPEITMAEKITSTISSIVSALLFSLAVVLLTIWLAPNFKNKVGIIAKKKLPLSLGIGLLASIIIVFASFVILLISNGLALGVSVSVILTYILALTISQTVFGMSIAKLISEKFNKDTNLMFIIFTLLVVLIIKLSALIPVVGALIGFVTTITGFGIILVNLVFKNKINDISSDNNTIKE